MTTYQKSPKKGIHSENDRQKMLTIGHNIKKERQRLKLTQIELAKEIGIATNSLQRYENGKIVIPVTTLIAIADFFGVSIESLCLSNEVTAEKDKNIL